MTLENARKSREKHTSVFMKYTNKRAIVPHAMFCFFEGIDNHYYSERIERYTDRVNNDIEPFNCEGRKNLFELHRKILKDMKYDGEYTVMFFCDLDYDEHRVNIAHLYQTPVYSIENFYTTIRAFESFLTKNLFIDRHSHGFALLSSLYKKD